MSLPKSDKAGYIKDGKFMGHNVWSVQKWLGYLFEEEVIALQKFVSELPDGGMFINIGAGGGTSGLLVAELYGERGNLTTIDIQDESSPLGCLEGERAVFESAGLDHLLEESWFQIHGDSKEVGANWKDGDVDFVFVDGDHTYEGCAGDIKAWLPHIKTGGYIAVHDFNKRSLCFDDDGKVKPHPAKFTRTIDRAVYDLLMPNMYMACLVQSLVIFEVDDDSVRKVLGEG